MTSPHTLRIVTMLPERADFCVMDCECSTHTTIVSEQDSNSSLVYEGIMASSFGTARECVNAICAHVLSEGRHPHQIRDFKHIHMNLSQGGQANKIRKIQDVMQSAFPLTPTPSTNRYREMPPISQQACKRRACEAIDHGMGQGYSLEDWYQWYLTEELTSDVMDELTFAWFPDHDIIRTVPDLTDFPFSPENAIVKVATPEMALNPLFDPDAVPSDQPPCSSSDQSDPWYVPKSMNFQSNLVVRKGIVFGYHSTTPNEVWNFFANGNTRLEPVQNNYFGSKAPMIRMPAF